MRFVIAPDSFKESMTAEQAANAMEKGIRNVCETCEVVKVPLADGGEGTADILINHLGAKVIETEVTGPLGDKVIATYGISSGVTAIMDVASVIGLHHVSKEKRNPLQTSTYGVGELILHALDCGVNNFIIGLGGSSTNDGGIGMLQALGVEILNDRGNPVARGGAGLSEVAKINTHTLDKRLKNCTFTIVSDVDSVLLGPKGATYTYGRQKGADDPMLRQLEHAMEQYVKVIERDTGQDVANEAGAGAAGGLGAAFMAFLQTEMKRGIDFVIELTELEKEIKRADVVFTGEGKIDDQTLNGKTLLGVASLAKKHQVPVIAIVGANHITRKKVYSSGITAIFPIVQHPLTLQESIANAAKLTEQTVENIVRLILSQQ